MKNNKFKIVCFFTMAVMLFSVLGCGANPVADYEKKLEDIGIIERIEETNNTITLVNSHLNKEPQLITSEDIEISKEATLVLISDLAELSAEIGYLDIEDEKVVNANKYLISYLDNLNEGLSKTFVMISTMEASGDLFDDIVETGTMDVYEEELFNEYINNINEANSEREEYFKLALEDLGKWSAALD